VETIMQRHHIDCEDDRAPGIRHFVRQNGLKKEPALLGAIRRRLPAPETLHGSGQAATGGEPFKIGHPGSHAFCRDLTQSGPWE
jgi:hypothetical protein